MNRCEFVQVCAAWIDNGVIVIAKLIMNTEVNIISFPLTRNEMSEREA